LFIAVQAVVAAWNEAAVARVRFGAIAARPKRKVLWYKTKIFKVGAVALSVLVAATLLLTVVVPLVFPPTQTLQCTLQPMRTAQQKTLVAGGAVIVYERNGGTSCVDELYAVYSDGKIVSDYGGGNTKTAQITPEKVKQLLSDFDTLGYFTPEMVVATHTQCAACYKYDVTITYEGQTRFAEAVDGGTDTSDIFWKTISELAPILYPGKS